MDAIRQFLDTLAGRVVLVILAIITINLVVGAIQLLVASRIKKRDMRYGVRRSLMFVRYLAAFIVLIAVFSSRLSDFGVALGVAGAGIAFALQEVIASIAGWIALSFGQFYTIGDRVQLGGIRGDVIDIGVLRTTIMEMGEWVKGDQYNGRIVRIANSFVFKEPVYNYSADFPFVWDELIIPIKYGSDHKLARALIMQAALDVVGDRIDYAKRTWRWMIRKYAVENAVVEPMVLLEITDNWMQFSLRYVVDFKKRRTTRDMISTNILDAIALTNGEVRIGSTTLQLVEAPTFDIRVHDEREHSSDANKYDR